MNLKNRNKPIPPSQTSANNMEQKAETKKELDDVIHRLLVIGLYVSVALILLGLALALFKHQGIPTTILPPGELVASILGLEPIGFLTLGVLVLIATPIFRVISSLVIFAAKKDWRFVGITFIVLVAVAVSIFAG